MSEDFDLIGEEIEQEANFLKENMIKQRLAMFSTFLSAGYYLKDYFTQNPDMMTKGQIRLSGDAKEGEVIEVDTTVALVNALFSMARNIHNELNSLGQAKEAQEAASEVFKTHGREK